MKKCVFRFCAGVLAAVLLSASVSPCYAISDKYTSTGTFWQAVADKWYFNGGVIPAIIGTVCDDVCFESPDKKHHGSLKTYEQNSNKSYTAVCDFCSAEFQVYDADLSSAYDTYVNTLPASGYTSAGKLTWQPTISDVVNYYYCSTSNGKAPASSHSVFSSLPYESVSLNGSNIVCTEDFSANTYCLHFDFTVPISGTYGIVPSPRMVIRVVLKDGSIHEGSFSYTSGFYGHADAGQTVKSTCSPCYYDGVSMREITSSVATVSFPVYEIIPDSALSGDTYNTNSRPTSITGGNYGIVGDNGQITKVEDNSTIVNETNNTFYNPATGTTVPITDWSYDYSDRSYKLTLDGGTTTTVTYGDENITIKEGDTVFKIYYLVDGSGSETPVDPPVDPPASCDHTWAETSSTPATCTTSGSKLSTCSKCQQTKTEPIPALGHDWQIKKSVTTQYDDTGQLVQKGYTIYECSRCHEQYKSEDGTGPPDTPPEDPGEEGEKKGFFSWLWGILSDTLKKLIEGVVDAILKTLDFFFGGDSQSNYDFYNSPSTFSGVSVWAS